MYIYSMYLCKVFLLPQTFSILSLWAVFRDGDVLYASDQSLNALQGQIKAGD